MLKRLIDFLHLFIIQGKKTKEYNVNLVNDKLTEFREEEETMGTILLYGFIFMRRN